MKKLLLTLLIIGLGLPAFSRGNGDEMYEEDTGRNRNNAQRTLEERPFLPGQDLILDLRTGGSIEITVSDREQMSTEIYKYGRAIELAEIEIRETSRGIEIMAYYKKNPRGGRHGVDMVVTVPSRCNLTLDTLGGDVSVDGVEGVITGKTLGGDIILSHLTGEIDMETLGGDIKITSSTLEGHVNTLGGDIRVRELQGNLQADTLGGKVVYLDSVPGSSSEPVRVDSLGGNINIDEAPAGIDAKTLGGHITIGRASDYVNAETLGGIIKIREIDGRIYASTLGGNVSAVMTGNPEERARDATMKSLGGEVSLTVPEGLSMDIEIILEITRDTRKDYKIISDFDLVIEEREATAEERKNNIRRVITGRGTTGDGQHRILLTTINGDIRLEQGD